MKHKGAVFEYKDDRDADLLEAYKREVVSNSIISLSEIAKKIAQSPTKRFWVSEERTLTVISAMERGDRLLRMTKNKRDMFLELHRRYIIYKENHPDMTMREIVFRICKESAPRWYLSPGSILVLLSKARKGEKRRCYEERKRRLRFMFSL